MDIQQRIEAVALKRFGISSLKPFQRLVIQDILEALDGARQQRILVVLPTGLGKSLCFMLPSLLCKNLSILVYPLLSLMSDQLGKLEALGIEAACLKGGQTRLQRKLALDKLSHGTRIVVTNPETLGQKAVLEALKTYEVSLLVVDEAHTASLWGRGFRPSYLRLGAIAEALKPKATLAFTATASDAVVKDIGSIVFCNKSFALIRGDADRPNIYYGSVQSLSRLHSLRLIVSSAPRPLIVFCRNRALTESLARWLKACTFLDCRAYHAGLSKKARGEIEAWFLKSSDGVLCSTNAYGMGVDKRGLRTVVHYRMPDCLEDFLQESGRAGRDGLSAWSWVLRDPGEKREIFDCCIRASVLKAFGSLQVKCSGCDTCMGVQDRIEGLEEIRAVLVHHPLRYDRKSLIEVLMGKCKDGLESYYGVLCSWKECEVDEAIDSCLRLGLAKAIGKAGRIYWAFKNSSYVLRSTWRKV